MTKLTAGDGWAFVPEKAPEPVVKANPNAPKPVFRVEKRAGKLVTVISGLHTYGDDRLSDIARQLKVSCGAGGTVKNGAIEIQGDKLAQIKAWFAKQKK